MVWLKTNQDYLSLDFPGKLRTIEHQQNCTGSNKKACSLSTLTIHMTHTTGVTVATEHER